MITLEEYKEILISTYRYEIDNNDIKKEMRKDNLNRNYSDEFLIKIINDTYRFILKIIESESSEYYSVELPEDNTMYISLNLSGGWFSDRIYVDLDNNYISEKILRLVFGNQLGVDVNSEEFEDIDDDIVSVYYKDHLLIYNYKNTKEIKNKIFGKEKTYYKERVGDKDGN